MFITVRSMNGTNYLPLDNEQIVLALLSQGYSFLEVKDPIEPESNWMEVIPHTKPLQHKDTLLLSQFLVKAPVVSYGVASSYLGN